MSMIVRRWMLLSVAAVATAIFSMSASSFAQAGGFPSPHDSVKKPKGPIEKPAYGNFYFETKIGSFRMLEYNDDSMPEGHFELNFTGTVLVDTSNAVPHPRGLQTTINTLGSVKKELDFHGRVLYHGSGKIIVDGGWHALQCFGRDINGKFTGNAVFRLTGEFDKNLETGSYWYDDGKKFDWGTSGMQPTVPMFTNAAAKPNIKINGKG